MKFVFPYDLIILIVYTVVLCVVYFLFKRFKAIRFLRSLPFAIGCMIALLFTSFLQNYFLIINILLILACLEFTILHRVFPFYKKNIAFLCHHIGLWLVLIFGMLSANDIQRYQMFIREGETSNIAANSERAITMPFEIRLNKLIIEQYDAQTPKNFQSHVTIFSNHQEMNEIIEVNKPIKIKGWKIYQYRYKTNETTLELVKDRWIPAVYFGFILLSIGAISMILKLKVKN